MANLQVKCCERCHYYNCALGPGRDRPKIAFVRNVRLTLITQRKCGSSEGKPGEGLGSEPIVEM